MKYHAMPYSYIEKSGITLINNSSEEFIRISLYYTIPLYLNFSINKNKRTNKV